MRKPKLPPDLDAISQQIKDNPELAVKILDMIQNLMIDKYYHWDKLQYLTPPEKFSNEQWWFAIKRLRQNSYKKLPLVDKNKKNFQYINIDFTTEIMH